MRDLTVTELVAMRDDLEASRSPVNPAVIIVNPATESMARAFTRTMEPVLGTLFIGMQVLSHRDVPAEVCISCTSRKQAADVLKALDDVGIEAALAMVRAWNSGAGANQ